MTPQTRARLTLAAIAAIALTGICILIITLSSPGSPQQATTTTSSATTPPQAAESADTQPQTDPTAAAAAFITAITADTTDQATWLEGLAPVTDPVLLASIASSDRDALTQALTGAQPTTARNSEITLMRDGREIATLSLDYAPTDDHESGHLVADPIIVTGLTLTDPPADTALPLSTDPIPGLTQTVQPAMTALVAQPGGLTDDARREQITQQFTAPEQALGIPRLAGEDQRIIVGNVQDPQLGTEDGQVTLTVLMAWRIDGTQHTQWTVHTIILDRAPDGTWTPKDAY